MDFCNYLKGRSYFARLLFWDEDEDCENPIFIKVPESLLAPPYDLKVLLEALREISGEECLMVFIDVEETEDKFRIIADDGMVSSTTLLLTTQVDDVEIVNAVVTPYGEYELICLRPNGSTALIVLDEELAEALGLEYLEDATAIRQEWLESIGRDFSEEFVYMPTFLYD